MTVKAIAELEFLPVLQKLLARQHGAPGLVVRQNGCDAGKWFREDGKISRAPDYAAEWGGKTMLYEFQYAKTDDLPFFDFKVSKVGRKTGGVRTPHDDRLFFYAVKSRAKYAFISPEWIMQNGKEGAVPAWGSRIAFRVPRDVFAGVLQDGGEEVAGAIRVIDDKSLLLDFAGKFYDAEAEIFSRRLQDVVDLEKAVKIMPRTLQGMYETCFFLERLGKTPDNAGMWLVYLLSFLQDNISARDLARFMFALDFLYSACESLNDNERQSLNAALKTIRKFVGKQKPGKNGLFSADPAQTPLEETRQVLFCANMLECIAQENVAKIFQSVRSPEKIAAAIRKIGG